MLPAVVTRDGTQTIDGLGLFHGDRLAGFLEEEPSKYIYALRGLAQDELFVLTAPDGEKHTATTLQVKRWKSRIVPFHTPEGELAMRIEVQVVADISGFLNHEGIDPLTDDANPEKMAQKMLWSALSAVVMECQTLGCDVLGFGRAVNIQDSKEWKTCSDRWDEIFPQIPVEIQVHVDGAG
ncbi:MAG: Ger(x)C family spore germination C-terminal domain-containing protein [Eubacteriales bacterium]|nr:Ger(x)C family spore germination C-terminal domain-containing protein [Eubacteriales bacterium]